MTVTHSKSVKAFTLLFSLSLLLFFLLYRTGYLENPTSARTSVQGIPNGSAITRPFSDTGKPLTKDSIDLRRIRLMIDAVERAKKDGSRPVFFSGSKSGIMFKPSFTPDTAAVNKSIKKPKQR